MPPLQGFSVLHVASAHGSEKCVKFLIQTFPDMKFHNDSVLKESPAHKAAKHLHPRVHRQLTSLGARDDLENVEVGARIIKRAESRSI
jgi:hypothetical protein